MLRKVAAIRPSELSARDHSHVGFPDWKPHKSPGRPQGLEVPARVRWSLVSKGGGPCSQGALPVLREQMAGVMLQCHQLNTQDKIRLTTPQRLPAKHSQSQTHRPLVETSQGPLGGQETSTLLSLPPPVPQRHSWPL